MFPGVTVWTVTGVMGHVVVARGAVVTGRAVAHIDAELAVGAGIPVNSRIILGKPLGKSIWTLYLRFEM